MPTQERACAMQHHRCLPQSIRMYIRRLLQIHRQYAHLHSSSAFACAMHVPLQHLLLAAARLHWGPGWLSGTNGACLQLRFRYCDAPTPACHLLCTCARAFHFPACVVCATICRCTSAHAASESGGFGHAHTAMPCIRAVAVDMARPTHYTPGTAHAYSYSYPLSVRSSRSSLHSTPGGPAPETAPALAGPESISGPLILGPGI